MTYPSWYISWDVCWNMCQTHNWTASPTLIRQNYKDNHFDKIMRKYKEDMGRARESRCNPQNSIKKENKKIKRRISEDGCKWCTCK